MRSGDNPSQRARALAGEPYRATDPELVASHNRALVVLSRYNRTTGDQAVLRKELLTELFGRAVTEPYIEPPFFCDHGTNIRLGSNVYANFNCVILDCNVVAIGDRVLLGPGVHIYAATHSVEPGERRAGYERALPVTIGEDVWLGGGVIVNPGVTIGANTTVGAGSVVTQDLPANVVACGNPCRVVRQLEDDSCQSIHTP